jgi:hypothetical protein
MLYMEAETMSIAAISPGLSTPPIARTPEALEGPGPDRDADADNKGASAAVSATSPGVGKQVDSKA